MKKVFFIVFVFMVVGGVIAMYLNQKFKLDKKEEALNYQYSVAKQQLEQEYRKKLQRVKENSDFGKLEAQCNAEKDSIKKEYQAKIDNMKSILANSNTQNTKKDEVSVKIEQKIEPLKVTTKETTKVVEVSSSSDKKEIENLKSKLSNSDVTIENLQNELVELKEKESYYKNAAMKRDKKIYALTQENDELKNRKPQIKIKEVVKTKIVKENCPKLVTDRINDLVYRFDDYKHATKSYVNLRCGYALNGEALKGSGCKDAKSDNQKANMLLNELEVLTKKQKVYSTYSQFIDKNRFIINQ
jgi:chromosome segregation ATPase